MITNSNISLSPSSQLRKDAVNSIKYTLLLNYKVPVINIIENPIPEIMKSCHECCSGLFRNELTKNDYQIYFGFFGNPFSSTLSEKRIKNNFQTLSFLDIFPPNHYDYPDAGNTGFPTMILDHCVISSYHAILTTLLHDKMVTSYEIVNNLKSDGFYSLYEKKRLDFQSENILKKGQKSIINNTIKSSTASDFTKKANSHIKSLPQLEALFRNIDIHDNSQFRDKYRLQFSGLFSKICAIDARKWNFIPHNITEQNKYKILVNIESLSNYIYPRTKGISNKIPEKIFTEFSGNPVDGLYHCYLTEKLFNFNLVYCLLRNLHNIEKETDFNLCQKDKLQILSSCQKLPNVFSRQYFLQYAFNQLAIEPISHLDFWHEHQLDLGNQVLESGSMGKKYFHFSKWLDQFSRFFDYMAEYVIPIYEWCFINMLMEAIEQSPLKEQNTHLSCDEHQLSLIQAINILAKYIQDNYKQILRPLYIPAIQETLDLITIHRSGIEDLNFSADFLQQLLETFCSPKRTIDLNLTPLTPDFFKSKTVGSERHIRNFYINLLFP